MDDADRAQIEIEREAERRDSWRAAHLVRAVPIRLGPDGRRICLGCGEPLSARRLAVQPAAVRCVECQDLAERGTARP